MFEFQVSVPTVLAGVTQAKKKSFLFSYPEQLENFKKGLEQAKSIKGQTEFSAKYNKDVPVFVNIMDLTSLEDANAIKGDLNELNIRMEGKPTLKTKILHYKNDQGQDRWLFGFRYNTDEEQTRRDERPAKRAELKALNAKLATSNVLMMTAPQPPQAKK